MRKLSIYSTCFTLFYPVLPKGSSEDFIPIGWQQVFAEHVLMVLFIVQVALFCILLHPFVFGHGWVWLLFCIKRRINPALFFCPDDHCKAWGECYMSFIRWKRNELSFIQLLRSILSPNP